MIDLGCKITKEYEVKQLPQSPLFYPPGQFPIINLENQQSLKEHSIFLKPILQSLINGRKIQQGW